MLEIMKIKVYHFADADYFDNLDGSITPYIIGENSEDKKILADKILLVNKEAKGIWVWPIDITEDLLNDFFLFKIETYNSKRGYLIECMVNPDDLLKKRLEDKSFADETYYLKHTLTSGSEYGKVIRHRDIPFDVVLKDIPLEDTTIIKTIGIYIGVGKIEKETFSL